MLDVQATKRLVVMEVMVNAFSSFKNVQYGAYRLPYVPYLKISQSLHGNLEG